MSSLHLPPSTAPRLQDRRMAGFTLLEIMVAMLLLTIIITSSVSLLFLNVRGWDALMADSEEMLDQILISDRIGNALRTLAPLKLLDNGQQTLAFLGEPQRLHFISAAPQQYLPGGLFEYLLSVEGAGEDGASLVLYYAPYRPDATALTLPETGEKRTLIDQVGDLRFSYYGIKRIRETAAWSDTWEAAGDNYPQLIKISLPAEDGTMLPQARFIRLLATHVETLR